MAEIPVIDEQEFDWEAEQGRVATCISALQAQSERWGKECRATPFRAAVQDAIHLLLGYYDELEGNR